MQTIEEAIKSFGDAFPKSFESFKKIICEKMEINLRYGDYKNEEANKIITLAINSLPKWLEDNFAEAFSIFNRQGATQFCHYLVLAFFRKYENATERFLQMLLLEEGSFLTECGSTLLCASIKSCQSRLAKYLLVEKQVSPNTRFHNQCTPLMLSIDWWGGDEKAHLEAIEILNGIGADFNALDLEGSTALNYAIKDFDVYPLVMRSLLQKGANPFLYQKREGWRCTNENMNTLSQAVEGAPTAVPLLCDFGAGLVCPNQRPFGMLMADLYSMHEQSVRNKFNAFIESLRGVGEIDMKPREFVDRFLHAPVIFRCQLEDKPQWIFSMEEFTKLLDPKTKMCDDQRERLDVVCHSVLMAPENLFDPQVLKLFKEYFGHNKDKYILTRFELGKYLRRDEPNIIESYLMTKMDKALMKKFP